MYCPNCKKSTDGKFCPVCGMPTQSENTEAKLNGQPLNHDLPISPKKKKKIPAWGKIAIIFFVIWLLLFAVLEEIGIALFVTSVFAMAVYAVSLIVSAIKKSSVKPYAICLATCFIMAIIGIICLPDNTTSSSDDNLQNAELHKVEFNEKSYNRLDEYEWGSVVETVLKNIGVEKIKKISIKEESVLQKYDETAIIKTEKAELEVWVSRSGSDDKWEVVAVRDKAEYKKLYYSVSHLTHDKNGNLIDDIYSYITGEIVEKADPEAKEKYELHLDRENAEREKEQSKLRAEKLKQAQDLPKTIISAYAKNAVKADEEYVGQTCTIAGTIESINNGVIPTTIDVEINCKGVSVICTFTEWESKEIVEMSKGDSVVITGRFDGRAVLYDLTFNSCVLDKI